MGRGADPKRKDGRTAEEGPGIGVSALEGRVKAGAERLVRRMGERGGGAHPGADERGVLGRMVGGMPVFEGVPPDADRHETG